MSVAGRRRQVSRATGPPPAAWAVTSRGVIRALVLLGSAVAVVGVALLGDPGELDADPRLWAVLVGCAAAGLVSAVRMAAVPVVPAGARLATMSGGSDPAEERASRGVARAWMRDAGWSLLLVGGAFLIRSALRVLALGGDPLELMLPLLFSVIWLTAYLVGWVLGLLLALGAGSAVRLAAAVRRDEPVGWEWWAVPAVFFALAVFAVTALVSVTVLGAPSSRGLGGFLGLLLWDFRDLAGWQLAVAWTTRISGLAVVASIVVLIVGRVRAGRVGPRSDARP